MKAKNCVKGVRVKTKVESNDLYVVDVISKTKRYKTNLGIHKGSVGEVTACKPDSVGDTQVKFENSKEVIINVKCLSKVKE